MFGLEKCHCSNPLFMAVIINDGNILLILNL